MIPVRLEMRNFLSYRDPEPVDFTGFDVACLSGENGAGKSALLDAMTWALFGAARGCEGGQNQDRVISQGAEETAVELTFDLGGASYRVARRRTRNAKSDVQFLVCDAGAWTNIAGDTVRQTEARIAETLRMDYRTFTASAFFVQGRADDFLARMRPEERKEVFARLLDIGAFERLEEAARTRARDAEAVRAERAGQMERLAGAREALRAFEREREEAERAASAAQAAAAALAEETAVVAESVLALEKARARLDAERDLVARLEAEAGELERSAAGARAELAAVEEVLARREEVAAAVAEVREVEEAEERMRAAGARAAELHTVRVELEGRVEAERRAIEARAEQARRTAEAAAGELMALREAAGELAGIDAALSGSEDPSAEIERTRELLAEQQAEVARRTEEMRSVDRQADELGERRALLAAGEGECPVCGGALDEAHRARVQAALDAESAALSDRRQRAAAAAETAAKESKRCAEEVRRLERVRREREALAKGREALAARTERLGDVEASETSARAEAAALEAALASGAFADRERRELERIAADLDGLYDASAHEAVRTRLRHVREVAQLAGRIEAASTRRTVLLGELDELAGRIREAGERLAERRTALAGLEAEAAGLPSAGARLEELRARAERAAGESERLRGEAARLTERVSAAQERAARLEEAECAEREAATTHRRYRRLAGAFGRGGIPDLIIDNARPELQAEANEILGRLTDYEMSVHFEMQRELKSGKAKDTFDVLVHHDGGLRDFAMFSGGEAFRVAFAVRLALSKLLVRRSGARLETLVIDEGFGTQDPQGRERLVEAITLARREFAKILVITHLDDLKDVFGAQIRVSKDPLSGSRVEVASG